MIAYQQWQQWAGSYTMLPYVDCYPLESDRLISWELAWREASPGSFVLESGKGGRYTYLGLQPVSEIQGKGNQATITELAETTGESRPKRVHGAPLHLVRSWMEPFRSPTLEGMPKFMGGCVGYWAYDVVRSIENLLAAALDDVCMPDYAFARFDQLWVIDHEAQMLYCVVHTPLLAEPVFSLEQLYQHARLTAARMKEQWDRAAAVNHSARFAAQRAARLAAAQHDLLEVDIAAIEGIQADFSERDYITAVRRIQDYIAAGDVFQVNLSVRQHKRLKQTPEEIFEWLRVVNPSPYMALLRFADFQLVSASPELLVQLEGDTVRTRPIAGTRPRGGNPQEDLQLADELIHHEKERAEHIMLLDLQRNDLGRISSYGTVRVEDFMVIEYYSHVMHIVSQVEGRLADGKHAYDVIAACFPGGTITGAPKIRTMEIIEELEPVRRGPYTGSLGWIDYNGNMEFNIIIRTLLVADGVGYAQAGAGIVIDSVPEREYTESLNKAKAIWKAIQYSETAVKNLV
ncbi:anthranilate synthase component I family protein [Paenibacillus xerothermodurans]|nr:anthranilate synthase component I family protein [Paenibacillus xerothermodurans]